MCDPLDIGGWIKIRDWKSKKYGHWIKDHTDKKQVELSKDFAR